MAKKQSYVKTFIELPECIKADVAAVRNFKDLFKGIKFDVITRKPHAYDNLDKYCYTSPKLNADPQNSERLCHIVYEGLNDDELSFFESQYRYAKGLVAIHSNYRASSPIFVKANDLGKDPLKTFKDSVSNCVNRRISLCTFILEKGRTPKTRMEDIEQICALAVEIENISTSSISSLCFMDTVPWNFLMIPKPSFMFDVAGKGYLIWTFEKPIFVPRAKKERTAVLNLLDKTIHTIAKKLSSYNKNIVAKAIKLNGSILAPGSLFVEFTQHSIHKEDLYLGSECYSENVDIDSKTQEELNDLTKRHFETLPKVDEERQMFRMECKTSSGSDISVWANDMPECIDTKLVEYIVNKREKEGSLLLEKTGSLFTMRSLTGEVLHPLVLFEDWKQEKEEKRKNIYVSIKPSKSGSNIADMLQNRLDFIKQIVKMPDVYKNKERIKECLKQFWIMANQLYQDRGTAYQKLNSFFDSLPLVCTVGLHKYSVLQGITSYINYEYKRTHAHFLEKLGFSVSEAIEAGFKMQTEEDKKKYQKEYQQRYYMKHKKKKYKELNCKDYHDAVIKSAKMAKAWFEKGCEIKEIAIAFGKSVRTIRRYLKMDTSNRVVSPT